MYNGNGESQRYLLCLNCVPIFQLLSRPKPKQAKQPQQSNQFLLHYLCNLYTERNAKGGKHSGNPVRSAELPTHIPRFSQPKWQEKKTQAYQPLADIYFNLKWISHHGDWQPVSQPACRPGAEYLLTLIGGSFWCQRGQWVRWTGMQTFTPTLYFLERPLQQQHWHNKRWECLCIDLD